MTTTAALPEEFGATCRRAGPDDPPLDLMLLPRTPDRPPAAPPLPSPGGRPVSHRFVRWRAALTVRALIMGKGKHRRPSLRERLTRRRPRLALRPPAPLEWVDLRTGITHLLTPDAAAAGRVRAGRYIALCGAEVIPAGLTEPGRGYCETCRTAIPVQRSRDTR